jgi:hypothetical protein
MHIECLLSTRCYVSLMCVWYMASDHFHELVHRGIGAIAVCFYGLVDCPARQKKWLIELTYEPYTKVLYCAYNRRLVFIITALLA